MQTTLCQLTARVPHNSLPVNNNNNNNNDEMIYINVFFKKK
jgi:hypothetical protein